MELAEERNRLESCYPQMFAMNALTNDNTRIRQLLTTSHQNVGILTSLTQLLVEIHNSFISKFRDTFPKKQLRYYILLLGPYLGFLNISIHYIMDRSRTFGSLNLFFDLSLPLL